MRKRAGCFGRERVAASFCFAIGWGGPVEVRVGLESRVSGSKGRVGLGSRAAGSKGRIKRRKIAAAFEGNRGRWIRDWRASSARARGRSKGSCGTTASVIRGLLRHNRVRDPRAPATQPRLRFSDYSETGALFVEAFGTHEPRSAAPSARSASDFRVSGHADP